MPFSPEVLDGLLKDCKTPEQMFGTDGLLQQLTKAFIERSLQPLRHRATSLRANHAKDIHGANPPLNKPCHLAST